jgi:hypothetical protein
MPSPSSSIFRVGAGHHTQGQARPRAKSATNKCGLRQFSQTDTPDEVCDRSVVYDRAPP